LRWLGDTSGDARDDHVDNDGQEGGEDSGEGVLSTTVLWHLDELLDDPANQVHPAHGGGEGEARNNGVEGLGFQFLGHEVNGLHSAGGHVSHSEFYTISTENNFILEEAPPFGQSFYTLVA